MADAIDDAKREAAAGTHLLTMFGLAAGVRATLGHVSVRGTGPARPLCGEGTRLPRRRPASDAAGGHGAGGPGWRVG